jgi:hypothetical protein
MGVLQMLSVRLRLGALLGIAMVAVLATAVSALAIEWQQSEKPIVAAAPVVSVSAGEKMHFTDSGYGVEVECNVPDSGTVGPGAAGTITIKPFECDKVKSGEGRCESAESVLIFNAPWKTLLVEEGGGPEDEVEAVAGAGEPRFEISCHNHEGAIFDDTCNMGGARATMTNGILSGTNIVGVLASFVKGARECGVGAEGNPHAGGEMEGPDFIYGCPNMRVH